MTDSNDIMGTKPSEDVLEYMRRRRAEEESAEAAAAAVAEFTKRLDALERRPAPSGEQKKSVAAPAVITPEHAAQLAQGGVVVKPGPVAKPKTVDECRELPVRLY